MLGQIIGSGALLGISRDPRERTRHDMGRLYSPIRFTDLDADTREQPAHIVDAAGLEIGFQLVAECLGNRGIGRQARIGPVIAGQNRELHAMGASGP